MTNFTHDGFRCHVEYNSKYLVGWCGYIAVQEGHPWYRCLHHQIEYGDFLPDGLSFTAHYIKNADHYNVKAGDWVIGFWTGPPMNKQFNEAETINATKNLANAAKIAKELTIEHSH